MKFKKFILTLTLIAMAAMCSSQARAEWVNGLWMYPYKVFVHTTISRRPYWDADRTYNLADTSVTNVPINNKGINVTTTLLSNGVNRAFQNINIWHCEVGGVWRTPGYHNDFVRICGGGRTQDVWTNVLLQQLDIHDGQGMPVLIQDGNFNQITLKDLRVRNTTVCLQVTAINTGHINQVYIENCPNMSIAIMGRPGSIGVVYVKNCPGARISDTPCVAGLSGAKVIHLN